MKKKISFIFGTRPEAIKLSPLILAFKKDNSFLCNVCVTAQHRNMLDQVLDVFSITPDRDLNLMREDQSLGDLAGRAIRDIYGYLSQEKPDLVLIQGDTTTVFCAALSAFYQNIPVGHVEAGLRTGSLRSPWPEEANRVLTSRLSNIHFAPTEVSRINLIQEGFPPETIFVTGNTVIDALFLALDKLQNRHVPIPGLQGFINGIWGESPLVLITGHRRENFGMGLENICQAILLLSERFPEANFVFPVHPNPNVKKVVKSILGSSNTRNIFLINPLQYLEFVDLMNRSTIIITDSGGIQEEAPSLGKPVLVTRDKTERPEAVEAGTVKIVGTNILKIIEEASLLLKDRKYYESMSKAHNPYGDGHATERILQACKNYFDVIIRNEIIL